jgi:hypothetical protein
VFYVFRFICFFYIYEYTKLRVKTNRSTYIWKKKGKPNDPSTSLAPSRGACVLWVSECDCLCRARYATSCDRERGRGYLTDAGRGCKLSRQQQLQWRRLPPRASVSRSSSAPRAPVSSLPSLLPPRALCSDRLSSPRRNSREDFRFGLGLSVWVGRAVLGV